MSAGRGTLFGGLFGCLFGDASMFPPEAMSLQHAALAHFGHTLAWYASMTGPLVCQATRLSSLDAIAENRGVDRIAVSMVVSAGLDALPSAISAAGYLRHIELQAVEVPLGSHTLASAVRTLGPVVAAGYAVFLEPLAGMITDASIHELARRGVRLKLRTGGTSIDPLRPEEDLARPIVLCAAERLAFKCAAGLHLAARHSDHDTLYDHHGLLNILLAARVAAATGSLAATRTQLAERNADRLGYDVQQLTPTDVRAIRALVSSLSTFSITDTVDDLVRLDLTPDR